MKEKASFKESGEDRIPRVDPDAPGLAPGEELAIDPVGGDEIDPIRKWWDEAEATSREKARNRRLEELEAGAEGILDAEGRPLPRRRKKPALPVIEVDEIPGLTGPKASAAAAPASAEEAGVVELPGGEPVISNEKEGEEALSLEDFAVAPLKRHHREEGAGEEFDLAELLGKPSGESVSDDEKAAEPDEPGDDGLEDLVKEPILAESEVADGPEMADIEPVSKDLVKEDHDLDLGDLLKPLAASESSALHFEFPDFEDEDAPEAEVKVQAVEEIEPAGPEAEAEAEKDAEKEAEKEAEITDEAAPVAPVEETEEADSVEAVAVASVEETEEAEFVEAVEAEEPVAPDPAPKIAMVVKKAGPPALVKVPKKIAPPIPLDETIEAKDGSEKELVEEETPAKPEANGEEKKEAGKPEDLAETIIAGEESADEDQKTDESAEGGTAEKLPDTSDSAPSDEADAPAPEPETDPAPAPQSPVDLEMAPVVETAAALPAPRGKAGCWTVFATLFFFATLLLVAGLGVAGWFAWSRLGDFQTELTGRVRADLEKKGIYLDYGDWGYQFPRGLVFDEVTIFDDATRERPFIKASGVGLNVDLLALAKAPGELRAGEINLEDSSLSLFEAGNLVSTIEGIDGGILAGSEEVRVDRLSALLGGWRVTLNGTVTLPQASVDPAATSTSADGETASAPLALDFSALKSLEPWLALGGGEGNAPALDLTFAMDADQPDLATIEGTILGRDVVWQGVDIASVTATFNVVPETGELSVPSFQIGYGQGFIGGRLAVDTATQRLRIEQLQSTVDVLALLGQYKPAWVEGWKSVRLVDAPSFQLTGEIPFEDPAQAALKIRYDHRQGLVVATEKGELPLRDLRGNFSVSRGSLETNDAGFELFGGSVMLNGATRLTDDARPFNGLIEITGLSLEKAAAFFGNDGTGMSGRLSFVFRGVGYSDIAKIRGGGTLRVEEAVIPDFPVLGQLQDYVGRAVPAFGVKGQGNLNGAYIIESGVLVASDLTVANTAARIVTNGSVNLVSYETDFTARAELVPSLASATGLTEKAITFAGKGPLSDPAVTLKSFPIEFASVSLGSILGTSPRSLATLRIVPGVEDAVAAFADQLGGPGITIHPEVTTFFKSLLGEETPAPEEVPVPQAE